MNRSNMVQQANLSRKTMVTKVTFERLFLLMKPTNMYIQVAFYRTLFFSKFTFKMFLFFMNRSNMVQQATLFRKTMVTKFMFFHSFCKRKNSSRDTIKDNLSRKEKKIPKITAQTYHLQIKMHKLNKHIFQYKKIFVNSKNRTLSLQVVSHWVPLSTGSC